MTSILGPYYAPHHHWQHDRDYVRALDPAWVRIHQPDALAIHEMTEAAHNARIMLRCWDIDDNNGERKREMYADPKGAARKHLEMWRAKWDSIVAELRRNNWAYDESRWYIGLVNEPDPAFVPQIVEYSLEAMRLVWGTNIRLGLVCSSVGNFSKPSENPNGWAKFTPLEAPMREGGHILIVHEYWQPEGPNYGEDGGNLAWRHHSIPLDVPILIGESGANGYIYQRYSQNDDSGWRVTVKDPNVYAQQVKEYIEGCDKRVVGVLLYMLDYHDKQWESFYTGPAAQQLLAIKDTRPQVPSPFVTKPVDTHLPHVPNEKPAEVQPVTDNWTRSREFVKRWEGDFQDFDWDIGNWTGGAVGKGEKKGTKYGISAASYPHLDIKNITMQQADDIYFRDYWQASGADKLPWPYCLIVFDTAVLHGTGAAETWLKEHGNNANAFVARRLRSYTKSQSWPQAGAGWVNRVGDLMLEASKP